jgi:hypothetical protein
VPEGEPYSEEVSDMEIGMDDCWRQRRPELVAAIADDEVPLDHHVEEVLLALSDLAGLRTGQHNDGENCP